MLSPALISAAASSADITFPASDRSASRDSISNTQRPPGSGFASPLSCGHDLAQAHPASGTQDRAPVDRRGEPCHCDGAHNTDRRRRKELPPGDLAEPDEYG